MGYTLELWATDIDALETELRAPTIDPATLDDDTGLVAELIDGWPTYATTIAAAIGDGGGEVGEELARYVWAVVRATGHFYGAVAHTSSGGDEFRTQFLPGPVATRIGRDAVADLVNRPLAGLTWADYPVIGHLHPAELTTALEHADNNNNDDEDGGDDDSDDAEDVYVIERAIRQAAHFHLGLVAVYG